MYILLHSCFRYQPRCNPLRLTGLKAQRINQCSVQNQMGQSLRGQFDKLSITHRRTSPHSFLFESSRNGMTASLSLPVWSYLRDGVLITGYWTQKWWRYTAAVTSLLTERLGNKWLMKGIIHTRREPKNWQICSSCLTLNWSWFG